MNYYFNFKKCLFIIIFAAVAVINVQGSRALAQTNISNDMVREHSSSRWTSGAGPTYNLGYYDNWGAYNNWFGGTSASGTNSHATNGGTYTTTHYVPNDGVTINGNDVITFLNGYATGGGTVNISKLDTNQAGSSSSTDIYGTEVWNAWGPNYSEWAWRTNNTGTITVGSGTTVLSASYGTTQGLTGGRADVPLDWQFRFDGGTFGKDGAGTLSLQTNTFIAGTFTGSNGTLNITGNTGDGDHYAQTDIGAAANLTGGGTLSTLGNTASQDNRIENGYVGGNVAGFTVTSGNKMNNILFIGTNNNGAAGNTTSNYGHANDGTLATGTGGGTLTGTGFNNLARIVVSGSGTLNNITNIGMTTAGVGQDAFSNTLTSGILEVSNTLSAGTTAADSVLNIAGSGSTVTVGSGSGTYQTATVASAFQHTNVREGGLLQVFGTANLAANVNGHDITTVTDAGSLITVTGTLVTGQSGWADLYIYNNGGDGFTTYAGAGHARIIGDHIIAQNANSIGRDIVDGLGSRLEVTGLLTVGESGYAGGLYTENRYDARFVHDPGYVSTGEPGTAAQGDQWFDSPYYTTGILNVTPGDPQNVVDGVNTGNVPGLAITRNAVVSSQNAAVAQNAGSHGYVVVDNRDGNLNASGPQTSAADVRTRWVVGLEDTSAPAALEVGHNGEGWVRVLNGALLQVGDENTENGTTIISGGDNPNGRGYLYIIGNGVVNQAGILNDVDRDADGSPIIKIDGGYEVTYLDYSGGTSGQRTEFLNYGAIILGANAVNGDGRGTLRIDDGAYARTSGLYVGQEAGTQGEVSVKGAGTWFDIYAGTGTGLPNGSGLFAGSDLSMAWIHDSAEVRINGTALISHGSILHLGDYVPGNPVNGTGLFDAMQGKVTVVNARVEGDGVVTGENGVSFLYDPGNNPHNVRTTIDPGQWYAWESRKESPAYYGTLIFGDQLRMTGDVLTNFDANSGYFAGLGDPPKNPGGSFSNPADSGNPDLMAPQRDAIIVQRGPASASTAQISARLSGELRIKARLTDYYGAAGNITDPNVELLVVDTYGDTQSARPGVVTRIFDTLTIIPYRFFTDETTQEIRKSGIGGTHLYDDEQLWVTMKRKNDPFESAGKSYNEKSVGKGLDSIYMDQIASGRKDWLPVLRGFWYIEDDEEFRRAYRVLSGEVRAHSLLLPMTDQFRYAHNRIDFRDCTHLNEKEGRYRKRSGPCDEIDGFVRQGHKPMAMNPCNPARPEVDPCAPKSIFTLEPDTDDITCDPVKLFVQRTVGKVKDFVNWLKQDAHVWGSVVASSENAGTDGNAGSYDLSRYGFVAGADRPFLRKDSYIGIMITANEGSLHTYCAGAKDDDFTFGLYHGTKFHTNWEWKSYAGMGIQDYKMWRTLDIPLTELQWDEDFNWFEDIDLGEQGRQMRSKFMGYSMSGSTEIARPFIFGKCRQYMVRPYIALDLRAAWQNGARETWDEDFEYGHLVALDFKSTSLVRVYGRPGFTVERNCERMSLHGGMAYAFLMGGRDYTDADNKFQMGGERFNIRGVEDGPHYGMWNFGGNFYFGKKKKDMVICEYWGTGGKHSVFHSAQLGFQHQF